MIDVNVVVKNKAYDKELLPILFGDANKIISEPILEVSDKDTMYDIVVKAGLYPSKSEARRKWITGKEVPPGFHDYQNIGKLHNRLTLWNPIETYSK